MRRVVALLNSLTGRAVIILTIGIVATWIVSFLISERIRQVDFARSQLEGVVATAGDLAARFANRPKETDELVQQREVFGVGKAPEHLPVLQPDRALGEKLVERLGISADPEGMLMPHSACFPSLNRGLNTAGFSEDSLPDCWFVRFRDARGVERRLLFDLGQVRPPKIALGPFYLLLIVLTSAILSFLVTRVTTGPLRRLTQAAHTFSVITDPALIQETGPSEVRAALRTFNIMQLRVRDGFRERTQLLASIAHDLQTPLARIRLRLEHVHEEDVRNRLIHDLAVVQRMVRDGLDLARSSESSEDWSEVDIDSILSSIAEDAVELDQNVRFSGGSNAHVRVKLNALIRCLDNLVDNALKYAGDAVLSCRFEGQDLLIEVRDHGPGISGSRIEEAMKPFSRAGRKPGNGPAGTGIGLTIARAQAETFGASLTLSNHPEGGLLAIIRVKHHDYRRDSDSLV